MSEEESQGETKSEYLVDEIELPKILSKDEAADCLNCVGPTFRKIDKAFSYSSCSYAYVAMDIIGRSVTNIEILPYFTHVMFLDLSKNRLTNDSLLPLAEMEQLITLVLDYNRLDTAIVPIFPQLQILSIKNNRIADCEVNLQPNLEYLELAGNEIQNIEPLLWGSKRLPKLKELGLRNNGLKTTTGINFTNLVSLFLADNNITHLEGLESLPNLKFLHLRNNPLFKLDGFSETNRKLFYLNIRQCNIKSTRELKKLSVLPRLERLIVLENPFTNLTYRVQVIAILPKLRKLDKTLVEKNEKRKAKKLAKRMTEKGGEREIEEDDEEEVKKEKDEEED